MLELEFDLVRDGFTLDVQLAFARGPTALVGPNGSGKSTVLRAILGAVPVRRGRIVLDGQTLLGRDGDPPVGVEKRLSIEHDPPTPDRECAEDRPEHRALACAVRADERGRSRGERQLHVEREVVSYHLEIKLEHEPPPPPSRARGA